MYIEKVEDLVNGVIVKVEKAQAKKLKKKNILKNGSEVKQYGIP